MRANRPLPARELEQTKRPARRASRPLPAREPAQDQTAKVVVITKPEPPAPAADLSAKTSLEDWVVAGEVSETGFCKPCRSHFCPHAEPAMYSTEKRAAWIAAIVKQQREQPR